MHLTASLLSFLLSLSLVHADGNFAASCPNIVVDSTGLSATCYNADGKKVTANLDINTCIVNNGGVLGCQPGGGFANSCDGAIELRGTTVITTSCATGKKDEYVYATIDINDCIGNHNGVLAC